MESIMTAPHFIIDRELSPYSLHEMKWTNTCSQVFSSLLVQQSTTTVAVSREVDSHIGSAYVHNFLEECLSFRDPNKKLTVSPLARPNLSHSNQTQIIHWLENTCGWRLVICRSSGLFLLTEALLNNGRQRDIFIFCHQFHVTRLIKPHPFFEFCTIRKRKRCSTSWKRNLRKDTFVCISRTNSLSRQVWPVLGYEFDHYSTSIQPKSKTKLIIMLVDHDKFDLFLGMNLIWSEACVDLACFIASDNRWREMAPWDHVVILSFFTW